jgi:predicted acylesterase/phospholipase RssA
LLANWLAEQERAYRTLVYTAEFGPTAWTSRCWRQSDCVLFVVGRESDPAAARDLVRELSRIGNPGKKRTLLAILHEPRHGEPRDTRVWTEAVGAQKLFHVRANIPEDVNRLTRYFCGRSVGLALGGGFARGLGHIGVVRAMRELGVPIDMVGGTSMGAIIAGQCALEWEWPKMLEISMKSSAASVRGDFTLPLVSFMTGRKMSRTIEEIGEGRDIEDALLQSFCVSANLMDGQMRVHTAGPAAKAVVASARMPVMFPPIFWDGALLVDGGLVNMVPAKTMREFCNGVVISVDCSAGSGLRAPDYGLEHSGWTELWRRLSSRASGSPSIGIMDILMHSFEFGRVSHANPARHSDLHLELPLAGYSHRDFSRGPRMAEASYRYALSRLEGWIAENGRPWEPGKGV